jgi:hypothetical protein
MRQDAHGDPQHPAVMDDIPELGDVAGLTSLYERAVDRIRRMDIDEHVRDAWLAEIGWQFDQAIEAVTKGSSAN